MAAFLLAVSLVFVGCCFGKLHAQRAVVRSSNCVVVHHVSDDVYCRGHAGVIVGIAESCSLLDGQELDYPESKK